MSKYNSPGDFSAESIILDLRRRIEHLERVARPSSTQLVHPIPASEWQTVGEWPVAVTSATFVDCFYFVFAHAAPTPIVAFQASCSDGTTAGEYRLAHSSSALTPLTGPGGVAVEVGVIPAGTTIDSAFNTSHFNPNYWDDLPVGTDRLVRLQVRRTAGAGTITVRARYLYQAGS